MTLSPTPAAACPDTLDSTTTAAVPARTTGSRGTLITTATDRPPLQTVADDLCSDVDPSLPRESAASLRLAGATWRFYGPSPAPPVKFDPTAAPSFR